MDLALEAAPVLRGQVDHPPSRVRRGSPLVVAGDLGVAGPSVISALRAVIAAGRSATRRSAIAVAAGSLNLNAIRLGYRASTAVQ